MTTAHDEWPYAAMHSPTLLSPTSPPTPISSWSSASTIILQDPDHNGSTSAKSGKCSSMSRLVVPESETRPPPCPTSPDYREQSSLQPAEEACTTSTPSPTDTPQFTLQIFLAEVKKLDVIVASTRNRVHKKRSKVREAEEKLRQRMLRKQRTLEVQLAMLEAEADQLESAENCLNDYLGGVVRGCGRG